MSFLIALVAFAAVFAVYSTIVTVLVEGIHKLFGLRSAGMSEMLRAFYDRHLASLQPANVDPEALAPTGAGTERASPQSYSFAKAMSGRSVSESLRPWYVRRWPIIGALLSSRQVRMTTLQFIERLAETPQGAALAGHNPVQRRQALVAAAYAFERLGEVQGLYFKARARLLAVVAGLAIAVFVNLDAIALYRELSANAQLSARLALLAESPALQQLQQASEDATSYALDADAINIDEFNKLALDLKAMGLPVGRSMFPHCENYKAAKENGAVDANFVDGGYRDRRCSGKAQAEVNEVWSLSLQQFAAKKGKQKAGILAQSQTWLDYRWQRVAVIAHNPQTFLMWALGVLIAGGLLGLGAPFWFGVFSRAASVVAPAARTALLPSANQPTPTTVAGPESTATIRPIVARDAEDLDRGFMISLGRSLDLGEAPGSILDATRAPPGVSYGKPPTIRSVDG